MTYQPLNIRNFLVPLPVYYLSCHIQCLMVKGSNNCIIPPQKVPVTKTMYIKNLYKVYKINLSRKKNRRRLYCYEIIIINEARILTFFSAPNSSRIFLAMVIFTHSNTNTNNREKKNNQTKWTENHAQSKVTFDFIYKRKRL